MILDFHTHTFPDSLAPRAVAKLEAASNLTAFTDGTLNGLLNSMKASGIDHSVILPVVTNPLHTENINNLAAQSNSLPGITSFGGMHPRLEGWEAELKRIAGLGLPGIKLHPDYQTCFADDPAMLPLVDTALELGLHVLLHTGFDNGRPEITHGTPHRLAALLDTLEAKKPLAHRTASVILAHGGGYRYWDDAEALLVGRPVYLDTSFCLGHMPQEQFLRLLRRHGIQRILFGTDSPWDGQAEQIKAITSLGLNDEELACILWRNGAGLLGLNEQ
ncbi:amidohydrolase family protein [Oscillospiraceae bacterium MB08-C2-2]|nr:amidohydrolase family protein [Oscillospiraceae bacterium MB08-C2-2]